jgi:hypothetical protein
MSKPPKAADPSVAPVDVPVTPTSVDPAPETSGQDDAGGDDQVVTIEPDQFHVLALVDLPEIGARVGQVIRGSAAAIANLPPEATKPATQAQVEIAAPRHIVLED